MAQLNSAQTLEQAFQAADRFLVSSSLANDEVNNVLMRLLEQLFEDSFYICFEQQWLNTTLKWGSQPRF